MKKTPREKKDLKLTLHRETLRSLDRLELADVAGGVVSGECHKWTTPSCVGTC